MIFSTCAAVSHPPSPERMQPPSPDDRHPENVLGFARFLEREEPSSGTNGKDGLSAEFAGLETLRGPAYPHCVNHAPLEAEATASNSMRSDWHATAFRQAGLFRQGPGPQSHFATSWEETKPARTDAASQPSGSSPMHDHIGDGDVRSPAALVDVRDRRAGEIAIQPGETPEPQLQQLTRDRSHSMGDRVLAPGLSVSPSILAQNGARSTSEQNHALPGFTRLARSGEQVRQHSVSQLSPVNLVVHFVPGGLQVTVRIGGNSSEHDPDAERAIVAAVEDEDKSLVELRLNGRRRSA
jgi:hypothetical protein